MVVEDLDLDAEEKFTLVGIRDVDYGAGLLANQRLDVDVTDDKPGLKLTEQREE